MAGLSLLSPLAEARAAESFWRERGLRGESKSVVRPDAPAPLLRTGSILPIPPSVGLLRDGYWPLQDRPGPWRVGTHTIPYVIHIQDLHQDFQAQTSLSRILQDLADEDPARELLVGVEGAWGPVPVEWLRDFPDAALRDRAAKLFLRAGWLTGEEYFAATAGPGRVRLIGVDDPALHRAHAAARRRTRADQARALAFLARFDARLQPLEKKFYPPALLILERNAREHAVGRRSLREYADSLRQAAGDGIRRFPALAAFTRMNELHHRLDANALRHETSRLLRTLSPRTRIAFTPGNGPRATLAGLNQLLRPTSPLKALSAYRDYLSASVDADPLKMEGEWEAARSFAVERALATLPPARRDLAREALRLARWSELNRKLWTLEMTPDDWRAYCRTRNGGDGASAERRLSVLEGRPGGVDNEAIPDQAPRDFYRLAERRNTPLVRNLLAAADRQKAERVVLVAGGFHTPGLLRRLRRQGASYAVVTPVPGGRETLRPTSRLISDEGRAPLRAALLALARLTREDAQGTTIGNRRLRRSIVFDAPSPRAKGWRVLTGRVKGTPFLMALGPGGVAFRWGEKAVNNWSRHHAPESPHPPARKPREILESWGIRTPWLILGGMATGLSLLGPLSNPETGIPFLFFIGNIFFPPSWGGTLGIWSLSSSRRPAGMGPDDLAIPPLTEVKKILAGLSASSPPPLPAAESLEKIFNEIQAVSDERSAALYARLSEDERLRLVHALSGRVLGRILHGFTAYSHERIITLLTAEVKTLRLLRTQVEKIYKQEEGAVPYFTPFGMGLPRPSPPPVSPESENQLRKTIEELMDKKRKIQDELLEFYTVVRDELAGGGGDQKEVVLQLEKRVQERIALLTTSQQQDAVPFPSWSGSGDAQRRQALAHAEAVNRRLEDELKILEGEELNLFLHPFFHRHPAVALEWGRNSLETQWRKEQRFMGETLLQSGAQKKSTALARTQRAAGELTEWLDRGLQDISAEEERDREAGVKPTPVDRPVLDWVESALGESKPLVTATVVTTSDHERGPFLRALARRFRENSPHRKIFYLNLRSVFADPRRNVDVAETLTGSSGLLSLTGELGGPNRNVILALGLDAFEEENLDVLEKFLIFWTGMPRGNVPPPPLIAIGSEKTIQTLLSRPLFKEHFGEKSPPLESTPLTQALLLADVQDLSHRLGIDVSPSMVEKVLAAVSSRTPYDRHAMALRVLETAMVYTIRNGHGPVPARTVPRPLTWEAVNAALAELPSLDGLPLDIRLWARLPDMPAPVQSHARQLMAEYTQARSETRHRLMMRLEALIRFPWKEKSPPRIPNGRSLSTQEKNRRIKETMEEIRLELAQSHFGLNEALSDAMDALMEIVVNVLQEDISGRPVVHRPLLLLGPPGVGKTTLVLSLARALHRLFFRIGGEGLDDPKELRGQRSTYVGAVKGKFARWLIELGVINPVLLLDEIDKIGFRVGGGDPTAALLEALDPEQNSSFDEFYLGVGIDLSGLIVMATANQKTLSAPLLSRFNVVPMRGYSLMEKILIGLHHVIPRLWEEIPAEGRVFISDPGALVSTLVRGYTTEEGARQLTALLRQVYLRALRAWFFTGEPVEINADRLEDFLGKPRETFRTPTVDPVGKAFAPVPGNRIDVLSVGVGLPSPSPLKITVDPTWGQAARESAELTAHWTLTHLPEWMSRLHHADGSPAGKNLSFTFEAVNGLWGDDSSRALAILVGLVSRAKSVPVRRDAAFLGSLDLSGKVGPIMELRRRALSAQNAGVRYLFLSAENRVDLFDDVFRYAPYLRGPVLNLKNGHLALFERAPSSISGEKERAVIAQWNQKVRALSSDRCRVTATGEDPANALILEGAEEELLSLLNGLPWIDGQMIYVLLPQGFDALRLGLLWPDTPPLLPSPDTPVLGWSGDKTPSLSGAPFSAVETSPRPGVSPLIKTPRPPPPGRWVLDLGEKGLDVTDFFYGGPLRANAELLTWLNQVMDLLAVEPADGRAQRAVENVLRALVATAPEAMGILFDSLLRDQDNRYAAVRDKLFTHLRPTALGQLLANARFSLIDLFNKEYREELKEVTRLERQVGSKVLRAITTPEGLEAALKAVDRLLAIVKKGGHLHIRLFQNEEIRMTHQRILDARKAISQDLPLETAKQQLQNMAGDLKALAIFLSTVGYHMLTPELNAHPEEVRQYIVDHLDGLIQKSLWNILPFLRRNPKVRDRFLEIWNVHQAHMALSTQVKEGRLVIHPPVNEANGQETPELSETVADAAEVVEDALERRIFNAVNLVCPSDSVKSFLPQALARALRARRIFTRVATVEFNLFPPDRRDTNRQWLEILQAAQEAGDLLLVVDLDDYRLRFGEERARFLSRALHQWSEKPSPLVFLSSEATALDFSQNLSSFFRGVSTHPLRVFNVEDLVRFEVSALSRRGVPVNPDAQTWIEAALERGEVPLSLVGRLLNNAASAALRDKSPVTLEHARRAWGNLATEDLETRVRMLPPAPREQGLTLLRNIRDQSSEDARNQLRLLENLLRFPWRQTSSGVDLGNPRHPLPLDEYRERAGSALVEIRRKMDSTHYGMDAAKEKILDHVVYEMERRRRGQKTRGKVLCLVGPAGVGKSTLGESIAKALGRKYSRISLGGIQDRADIVGHSSGYEGALPGKLAQALQRLQERNAVLILDELDKIPSHVADALLSALDSEQNAAFPDAYLGPVDLSEVVFICTANDESRIPAPLLDRMEIIRLSAYDRFNKINIGRLALEKIVGDLGITEEHVRLPDVSGLMALLVDRYTWEAGARDLMGLLKSLLQKARNEFYLRGTGPVSLTPDEAIRLLGRPLKTPAENGRQDRIGQVTGLVVGPNDLGGTIEIQATVGENPDNPEDIKVVDYGQLQEDMKYSINRALDALGKFPDVLGLPPGFLRGKKLTIHIPRDIQKGGPSAGAGFAVSIASALTRRPVRGDVAMTGKIDSQGHIDLIGGLEAKIGAAVRQHYPYVILPAGHRQDLLTLFDASPDLRGLIEYQGIQRYILNKKKPLPGIASDPDSDYERAWTRTSDNLSLATVSHRMVTMIQDRESYIEIAGPPAAMTAFLEDPLVKPHIAPAATYILVDTLREILERVLLPPLEDSSPPPPSSPPAGPSPLLAGAIVAASLFLLTGWSPDASAASLNAPFSPGILPFWGMALAASGGLGIRLLHVLRNFFSGTRPGPDAGSQNIFSLGSFLYHGRLHFLSPDGRKRLVPLLRLVFEGADSRAQQKARRFSKWVSDPATDFSREEMGEFLESLGPPVDITSPERRAARRSLVHWILGVQGEGPASPNGPSRWRRVRWALEEGFKRRASAGMILNLVRAALATEGGTGDVFPSPPGETLWRAALFDPGEPHQQDVIVVDGDLLNNAGKNGLTATLRAAERAQKPIVIASFEAPREQTILRLKEMGLPSSLKVMGPEELAGLSDSGGRVRMDLLKARVAAWLSGSPGTGSALRILVWADAKSAPRWEGVVDRLLSVEREVLLEGHAAEAFNDRLRHVYSPRAYQRFLSDFSADGGKTFHFPPRAGFLSEIFQSLTTDILIQTQA